MGRHGQKTSCVSSVEPVIEPLCGILQDSTGGKQPELSDLSKEIAAQLKSMQTVLGLWQDEGKSRSIWQVCVDFNKDLK